MNRLSTTTRRRFLLNTSILAVGWDLSCGDGAPTQELAPTTFCHDRDEPTVSETEGPFFKPRSPELSDLREPGAGGRRFELSGIVLSRSCRPLRSHVVLGEIDQRPVAKYRASFNRADGILQCQQFVLRYEWCAGL